MRAIKKGEISVKMVYTVTFIGLFLIFAVYGLFTVYDVRRTEKAADKTLLFAKARVCTDCLIKRQKQPEALTKKHMMKVFSRIMFMNRDSEEYVYLIRI